MKDMSNKIATFTENELLSSGRISSAKGKIKPAQCSAVGNTDILYRKKLALFCSVKCPGNIIVQTYDAIKALRDAGIIVIGGFHSPMEKECLNILLRGPQPVIICPARSIAGMRIKPEHKKPLEEGRLLFLSPFSERDKRISAKRADVRNHFVASAADALFIAHAAPGGKTEQFCYEITKQGKVVFTIMHDANSNLLSLGVKGVSIDNLIQSLLANTFRGELVPQDPNDEPASELLKRLSTVQNTSKKNPINKMCKRKK